MRLRMDPWSRVTGVPGSLYRALPGEDEGAPEDEEPRPRRRGPRERVTRRFRRVFLAWLGGLLLFFTAVNLLVCWRAGKQKAYDLGFPGLNALIALNVSLPLALLLRQDTLLEEVQAASAHGRCRCRGPGAVFLVNLPS